MAQEIPGERRLLRAALLGDSMIDGGMGLACILAAGPVAALLGLEAENATLHLRVLGLILFASGAVLLWASASHRISRRFTTAVVVLNMVWVVTSIAVAFGPWLAVTEAGRVVLVVQALLLAVVTAFQAYCTFLRGRESDAG